MEILPISAFNDNYIWICIDRDQHTACVVDPGDANAVIDFVEVQQLQLTAILITHHHQDHTGGINELRTRYHCEVFGPDSNRIPHVDHKVDEGDRFPLLNHVFEVLSVPGHTLDHIAYFCADHGPSPVIFCGDTLFAGGCGRVFEGTPRQMLNSLNKIAHLPAATLVYCAHEYTLANLCFAAKVEPDNPDVLSRLQETSLCREQQLATVPSTIATELASNPFLRVTQPQVIASATARLNHLPADDVEVFAAIRGWKDVF